MGYIKVADQSSQESHDIRLKGQLLLPSQTSKTYFAVINFSLRRFAMVQMTEDADIILGGQCGAETEGLIEQFLFTELKNVWSVGAAKKRNKFKGLQVVLDRNSRN